MTKLRRVSAISILIVALFGVAMAGDTLTPPNAPPPPAAQYTSDDSSTPATSTAATPALATQDPTLDIVNTAEVFAVWLLISNL